MVPEEATDIMFSDVDDNQVVIPAKALKGKQ